MKTKTIKEDTNKVLTFDQPENKNRLWDMSDTDQVKEFIDELQSETSNSQILTGGLVLLLSEIENKPNFTCAKDFCNDVIRHLFSWTFDHDRAQDNYKEGLKSRSVDSF